jgi:hypothetical protein
LPRKSGAPTDPSPPRLTQPAAAVLSKLQDRIAKGQELRVRSLNEASAPERLKRDHDSWTKYNATLLRTVLSTDEFEREYLHSPYAAGGSVVMQLDGWGGGRGYNEVDEIYQKLDAEIPSLETICSRLELYPEPARELGTASVPVIQPRTPIEKLDQLANRFHVVARQLQARHGGRPTLKISDEYDVQDLLHALLLVEFEDVRPEEYVPTYAGGSSRMDFLLKKERVVFREARSRYYFKIVRSAGWPSRRVPNRTTLHENDRLLPIAPDWSRGQPK